MLRFPFPNAIIFDMDGLMIDSESIYHQAWEETAKKLGYQLDKALYLSLVGRSNDEAEKLFLVQFGEDFPLTEFRSSWRSYWREFALKNGIPLKPGLLELLDRLELENIPKIVATSSDRHEAEFSLTQAKIKHRFRAIVTVSDVKRGKPAPDLFLLAAKTLNIAPESCLVLEDSNAGILAAKTAGIPAIMIPDLQEPSEASKASAAYIFSSLQEVYQLLF